MGWPVLYIHGNGNQVREDLLKRHWDAALFDQATDASSRMAYWPPLPYPPPLAADSVFDKIDLLPATSPLEVASPSAAEAPEAVVAEPLETWLGAMVYKGDALADGEDAAPPASALELPSPVKAWRAAFDARDLVVMDHAIRPEYRPMEKVHHFFAVNDSPNYHGFRSPLFSQRFRT